MPSKKEDKRIELLRNLPNPLHIKDPESQRAALVYNEILQYLMTEGTYDKRARREIVGGVSLSAGANITITRLGPQAFRIAAEDVETTDGGGGGGVYTGADSIVLEGTTFTLVEDEDAPGNNKRYGTNESGDRGWHDADVYPEDPASPVTIGSAAEGAEGAESSTKTFDSASGVGLKLYVMTRVAYYDTGDQKLYGYVRELRFTKYGRLYYVSAETRVEIDVPVEET